MTLATHAIIGASAAAIFSSNPAAALAAAFASHLAADAIPHWDYTPRSLRKNRANPLKNDMELGQNFLSDLLRIGGDALLGLILALAIFRPPDTQMLWIIALGAVFGVLPDPLQFVYWKTRSKILKPLQRFHIWIQPERRQLKCGWVRGLFYQALVVLTVVTATIIIL